MSLSVFLRGVTRTTRPTATQRSREKRSSPPFRPAGASMQERRVRSGVRSNPPPAVPRREWHGSVCLAAERLHRGLLCYRANLGRAAVPGFIGAQGSWGDCVWGASGAYLRGLLTTPSADFPRRPESERFLRTERAAWPARWSAEDFKASRRRGI